MYYFLSIFFILLSFSHLDGRINFIHIPKCGGTTIHSLLEKFFYTQEIHPQISFLTPDWDQKNFIFRENDQINYEFISGHFPIWFLEEKDDQFDDSFKFTVLRHPIDRVISEYKYRTYNGVWNSSILDLSPNVMCKMLCSNPYLEGEELLADCKRTLSRLDLIIFCDEFDNGVTQLFDALGLELKEEKIGKLNESVSKEQFSQEVIDEITHRNDLDSKLYDYAKIHFQNQQVRKYPLQLSFLQDLSEPKKEIYYTFDMPALQKGWLHRENVGTCSPVYQWVGEEKGSIYFHLKSRIKYQIQFQATALMPHIMPKLLVNGTNISLEKMNNKHFSTYKGIIPSSVISRGLTEFTFLHPCPMRFNQVYPEAKDTRLLSVAVSSITIIPD